MWHFIPIILFILFILSYALLQKKVKANPGIGDALSDLGFHLSRLTCSFGKSKIMHVVVPCA